MKNKKIVFFSVLTIGLIITGSVLYFIFKDDDPIDNNIIDDDNNINIDEEIDRLMSLMTVEEKISQLHGLGLGEWELSFDTADNDRLGIPGFRMMDGPHGVRDLAGPATAFPVGIAMTATWDPELIERIGKAMGEEFRGYHKSQGLGPCIDLQRDPRNGRSPETGGEDPYLAGWVGASLTQGIQSTGTIATVKHFAATNHQTGRRTNNYAIDERSLMELYGYPFRLTVQEGDAWSVMNAYNYINDKACSANYNLLTEILRNQWGYEYYVVSDWWSIYDGAAEAINAGVDVDMPGDIFGNELLDLIISEEMLDSIDPSQWNNYVTEETLDQAVERVLRTKLKSGMIYRNATDYAEYEGTIGSLDHNRLALEAAQKSMILLKNEDNILPFDENSIDSIALIGPSADEAQLDGYGSSWVTPFYSITPKGGIENRFPDITINYAKGCDINSDRTTGFQEAKDAAASSDVVVFVGGLDKTQEGEGYDYGGDRKSGSVDLPGQQQNLINELAAINSNLVVVLKSGGICAVEDSFENIKGFIYAFYPGQEGGRAIADALFGNINPGGKLPVTMPKNDAQLPDWEDFDFSGDVIDGFGYRRFDALNLTPRYPFGYGLSYTTFDYSNLKITNNFMESPHTINVSVDVSNTGSRNGDEIVQLYLSTRDLQIEMPEKQLRGFKRINLDPGETKTVDLSLGPNELNYWNEEQDSYMIEAGEYWVQVGGSSDNLPLSQSLVINNSYLYDSANNTLISLDAQTSAINILERAKIAVIIPNFATNVILIYYGKRFC